MPLPVFVSETIHHEAIGWATRVSANGGTISTTTIRAVSDFCAAIDRGGLRDRFARLNVFAGGNLSGALVPLYRSFAYGGTVLGNATDTNANFVSGDFAETGATGGLKGNATNKYLDTGVTLGNIGSTLNLHLAASATSLNESATRPALIGVYTNAGTNAAILWQLDSGARQAYSGNFNAITVTQPASESLLIFSRSTATSAVMYRDGTQVGSSSVGAGSSSGTSSFGVFALGGTPSGTYSPARMRIYSIGTSLSATQAAAFSAAVSAFNTALGR